MKYNTKTGKTLIIKPEKEINRGGEGKIMLVENHRNIVAKLFHKPQNNSFEKSLIYLNKLDKRVFIIPQELLFQKSKFVGYTMPYVDDKFFPISTIFSKNFCQKNNIDYNFKKKIIERLRFAVENAHKNDIIIGDLNQFNILINLQGELKIIDTDSFETPENIHSGVLLDDIRDYLYNGNVSQKSDYYAFSVLVFYLLTFVHPFKGIHKQYKGLKDRIIHKLPVIVKDPDLKIPNFYSSVTDKELYAQFERIYVNGERFLINIENSKLSKPVSKQINLSLNVLEKDITVNQVLENVRIIDVFFNDNLGYVETESLFIVYSSKNRGYLNKKYEIKKVDYDKIFIGNNNILLQKSDKLFHFKNEQEIVEIKNFVFSKNIRLEVKENIIIVFEKDKMFWLFIDEILNSSIKNQRFEVFGESFSLNTGLIQNTGGIKRIFYNSGTTITGTKSEKNIKSIIQRKNVGMLQFVEKNKVLTKFFIVKENKMILSDNDTEGFSDFCYMKTSKTDGMIFIPNNKSLSVIRTDDFVAVSEIKCSVISENTRLYYSKSGIIAFDENNLFLINSKI